MEAILAERAALAWFSVSHFEATAARPGEMTIVQADFEQRRLSRAHGRFLSAVKALAYVRRMAAQGVKGEANGCRVRVESTVAVTVEGAGPA